MNEDQKQESRNYEGKLLYNEHRMIIQAYAYESPINTEDFRKKNAPCKPKLSRLRILTKMENSNERWQEIELSEKAIEAIVKEYQRLEELEIIIASTLI